MKVMGFRADPSAPRYAIVEGQKGGTFTLLNAATDSKLAFPAQCTEPTQQLHWLAQELERILHDHPDIAAIIVKANEFGTESTAKRLSTYQDATVILHGGQKGIPVQVKTYASLSTKSASVKLDAAARVGQTTKYWDNKMADAVIAAWWGITTL